MEEIKISVEIKGEVKQADRLEIQDVVEDALRKAGYEIVRVRVYF